MAISRFKTSTLAQGLPKYQKLWDGISVYSPSAYESIATATLTSTQSSVTFNSIPQTYKHLQIRSYTQNVFNTLPGWDWTFASYNGDTNYTKYRTHILYGNGSSAGAATLQSSTYTGGIVLSTSRTYWGSAFSPSVVDILDYSDTNKMTTTRSLCGLDVNSNNTYGEVDLVSSVWLDTSAVTSITLYPTTASLGAGSKIALYGIKG